MVPISHYVNDFFHKNKKKLNYWYPGLTLSYLNNFLEEQGFFHSNDQKIILNKILKGIPLSYISGRSFFYKSELFVNENVLIPRSETEIMVENALDLICNMQRERNERIKVLDVGTGSGAIIISLLKDLEVAINAFASDISFDALEIAKKNYFHQLYSMHPEHSLEFIESDRLDNIPGQFDFIISNPPYIKANRDLDQVHQQVKRYEPKVALFLDDDQYDNWFETFFKQVYHSLSEGGIFLMEGHENHLESLSQNLSQFGFENVKVLSDYSERDRFLIGYKG